MVPANMDVIKMDRKSERSRNEKDEYVVRMMMCGWIWLVYGAGMFDQSVQEDSTTRMTVISVKLAVIHFAPSKV